MHACNGLCIACNRRFLTSTHGYRPHVRAQKLPSSMNFSSHFPNPLCSAQVKRSSGGTSSQTAISTVTGLGPAVTFSAHRPQVLAQKPPLVMKPDLHFPNFLRCRQLNKGWGLLSSQSSAVAGGSAALLSSILAALSLGTWLLDILEGTSSTAPVVEKKATRKAAAAAGPILRHKGARCCCPALIAAESVSSYVYRQRVAIKGDSCWYCEESIGSLSQPLEQANRKGIESVREKAIDTQLEKFLFFSGCLCV